MIGLFLPLKTSSCWIVLKFSACPFMGINHDNLIVVIAVLFSFFPPLHTSLSLLRDIPPCPHPLPQSSISPPLLAEWQRGAGLLLWGLRLRAGLLPPNYQLQGWASTPGAGQAGNELSPLRWTSGWGVYGGGCGVPSGGVNGPSRGTVGRLIHQLSDNRTGSMPHCCSNLDV